MRLDGNKAPRNQKGVTLIELSIVIAIIALAATFLSPNLGNWIQIYRLKGATRDIVSAMRAAQMKAVSSNAQYRVSFAPANSQYFLEISQDGGTTWSKEGETQSLPSGLQLNTTFAGNAATFYPNASSTNGTVTVINGKGSRKTIQIFGTTGRIKHG